MQNKIDAITTNETIGKQSVFEKKLHFWISKTFDTNTTFFLV